MSDVRASGVQFKSLVAGLAATAAATLSQVEALLETSDAAPPEAGTGEPPAGAESPPSSEDRAARIESGLVNARHLVDTLAMLKEKTRGNLSDDERDHLQATLTQLRVAYVRVMDRSGQSRS